jgi:hypothetical protein
MPGAPPRARDGADRPAVLGAMRQSMQCLRPEDVRPLATRTLPCLWPQPDHLAALHRGSVTIILDVGRRDTVLEIGTGLGLPRAAVLSRWWTGSIPSRSSLSSGGRAAGDSRGARFENVETRVADGYSRLDPRRILRWHRGHGRGRPDPSSPCRAARDRRDDDHPIAPRSQLRCCC